MKIAFRVLLLALVVLVVLSPNFLIQIFDTYPKQYVILAVILFGLGMLVAIVWLILARTKDNEK